MSLRCKKACAYSKAHRTVQAGFMTHALLFASWAAHIPEVESHIGATDGGLGIALLGAPIGGVIASVICTGLLVRAGSHRVVQLSLAGYALGGVLVGLAGSVESLFAALALWGFFGGALDTAINTQAVTLEKAMGRPIMSRLHGMWSIGGVLGALLGAGAVALGVGLSWQIAVLGSVALMLVGTMSRSLIADGHQRRPADRRRNSGSGLFSMPVLVLLMTALASMFCEGAAADWSAAYLHTELRAPAGLAGLAYAGFAAAMVVVRLAGPIFQGKFTTGAPLSILAAVATVGMSTGLLIADPAVALIGFGTLGVGVGLVVPTVISVAGSRADAAQNAGSIIATIAIVGWSGYLAGPPLIGFMADRFGLAATLWTLPTLTALIAVLGRASVFATRSGISASDTAAHP